jgi:para-aminobenzoate synthetase/4-amino-4-deoxychorismate lyase
VHWPQIDVLDLDPDQAVALLDFPAPSTRTGLPRPDASRQRWRFERPRQWLLAHDPRQVPALLDAAHALSRQGHWCIGWVAYEAAPGLNDHLPVKALPPGQPYAVWAVFDEALPWPDEATRQSPGETQSSANWTVQGWQADLDDATVMARIDQIHALIRAGEVYQVNLTTQWHAEFAGAQAAVPAYFDALQRSQPRGYALMLDTRAACRAPGVLLSVSPELFFEWDGQTIVTRPMKGTAARGLDPRTDLAAVEHLKHNPKERAENLMIVDLLRNDLSRVAEVGTVKVPSLFDVQALPTGRQMTSTVTAQSRAGLRLSELFAALFPCGSVTGAPKRQAMHHIARLEQSARGVYCGAAGFMAPGGRVTLNVPIRTVCLHTPPAPAPWRLHAGVGSGITLDATGPGEVAEWQAKRAFLKRADQPFDLLESLRLEHGHIPRLERHLQRLRDSAQHFGWLWTPDLVVHIRQTLEQAAREYAQGCHKVRLLLSAAGNIRVQVSALTGPGSHDMACPPDAHIAPVIEVALAHRPMPDADDFVRHKTTCRRAYADFLPDQGCFDTLLYNRFEELTEFTIGNVAVQLEGHWYTPPLSAGLLPGVMRASLLSQGLLTERRITLADLSRAQGLALLNSVRGWLPAALRSSSAS